ncbi:MAG: YceI family protein [Thermomicrobiales bacterium]
MTDIATRLITLAIDRNHSLLEFAVKHMKFTTVKGRFEDFSGTILFDPDDIERSSVDVTIDTASLNTGIGARDTHLRSADFFDVKRFPIATFHSTSIEGDRTRFTIDGELTIRDVTRPISLRAEYQGSGVNPSGVEVSGFEATGRFNRRDFGLNWNQALESGGVLVSDEVRLDLDIQAH